MGRTEMRGKKQRPMLGAIFQHATSRAQLDDLYRDLTSHPMVTMVL